MSHSTLIDNLRAKGEEEILAIRREAGEELEKLQAEATAPVKEEECQCRFSADRAGEDVRRKMTVAARRRAANIATRAEQELNERLYVMARRCLQEIAGENRSEIFTRLAREIPPGEWQSITVHPDDESLVEELYPEAEIIPDDQIIGGLIASGPDGAVTVDNTLVKRLQRLWPKLAPEILRDLVDNEKSG